MSGSSLSNVFGTFQNLNLLILIEDLRRDFTARGGWSFGNRLCPLSHRVPAGSVVEQLVYLGQVKPFSAACELAASQLGVRPGQVETFVNKWDSVPGAEWLLNLLTGIWLERLDDAEAMQEILTSTEPEREVECPTSPPSNCAPASLTCHVFA